MNDDFVGDGGDDDFHVGDDDAAGTDDFNTAADDGFFGFDEDAGDDGFTFEDDDQGLEGQHWADEDDNFQDHNYAGDDLYELNDDVMYRDADGEGYDDATTGDFDSYQEEEQNYTPPTNTYTADQQKGVVKPPKIATSTTTGVAKEGVHKEHPILLVFFLVGIAMVLMLQNIVKRSSPSAKHKRDDGDGLPLIKNGKPPAINDPETNGKKK